MGWLRERRRAKLLAGPFPDKWRALLEEKVALYRRLPPKERDSLHDQLRVFAAERDWEGCGGLRVTDEMKVVISALACMLTLGRGVDEFDIVRTILVYPAAYRSRDEETDESGVVAVDREGREGEAWSHGAVVLSWKDVRRDASRLDGRNLVLHEFAHQLDMGDGVANGTPALSDVRLAERWKSVMTEAFERLKKGGAKRGEVLDLYGAEDESEFFAVATEAFFELPAELAQQHPGLYSILRDYYRRDPVISIGTLA